MPPWPARELDGSWDAALQIWRYRRLMEAIHVWREYYRRLHRRHGHRVPMAQQEVLIAVPVPEGWATAPGQRTICAYDCEGELLTGTLCDGQTVLAYFPLVPLWSAIRARLQQLRQQRQARASRQRPLGAASTLAA
jgi:hypothetical protein